VKRKEEKRGERGNPGKKKKEGKRRGTGSPTTLANRTRWLKHPSRMGKKKGGGLGVVLLAAMGKGGGQERVAVWATERHGIGISVYYIRSGEKRGGGGGGGRWASLTSYQKKKRETFRSKAYLRCEGRRIKGGRGTWSCKGGGGRKERGFLILGTSPELDSVTGLLSCSPKKKKKGGRLPIRGEGKKSAWSSSRARKRRKVRIRSGKKKERGDRRPGRVEKEGGTRVFALQKREGGSRGGLSSDKERAGERRLSGLGKAVARIYLEGERVR